MRLPLPLFTITRTIINTSYRLLYPFLPFIAGGLDVSLEAVTQVIVARSLLGAVAPVFGAIADSFGRRTAMLSGLGLLGGGLLIIAIAPTYPGFIAAVILSSIGKIIFDPALLAYIGDRVPYERRGRALALTELGWSLAFLLGIPAVGLIIDLGNWATPFPIIGGLGLLAAVAIWRTVPPDPPLQAAGAPSLFQSLVEIIRHPVALGGLAITVLISAANEVVNIVYGVWMEDAFSLTVTALGAYSAVIGFAELGGETLVAAFVDRIGKARAIWLGLAANAAMGILLPFIARDPATAMLGLFLFFLSFEFTIVSAVPLITELAPHARGTIMAANVTAFSIGRALGGILGPMLYAGGLLANGAATAILNLIGVGIVLWVARQIRTAPTPHDAET